MQAAWINLQPDCGNSIRFLNLYNNVVAKIVANSKVR